MDQEQDNGWDASADAWLSHMGETGDFSRVMVLDAPMLERVRLSGARTVLDVGCGEGRFCRMMAGIGLAATGIDPTARLLDVAQERGRADYVQGRAEELPFETGQFDLVVSYLSLIDVRDYRAAISEMARVLRPGGHILIGNLTSWITASQTKADGWTRDADGAASMIVDRYLEEHAHWGEWSGMRIRNWHRPLSAYMGAFLANGLALTHFDEPKARDDAPRPYDNAPYLYLMEWEKV